MLLQSNLTFLTLFKIKNNKHNKLISLNILIHFKIKYLILSFSHRKESFYGEN